MSASPAPESIAPGSPAPVSAAPMFTGKEELTEADLDRFYLRCSRDFLYYAPRCLKIKPKAGGMVPFVPNFEQEYIHRIAENQLIRDGHVRIIVLKGRQQGASTYIEGRFYWKTSHSIGKKAYILTHESDATKNLFEMAERYHENCPVDLRPVTGKANAKELSFKDLDTLYGVGTAGAKGTGRSQTIHFFHGSEVGYWPNAESHASGVMEGVATGLQTEVWLESTSNGAGDYFHSVWKNATSPGAKPKPDANEYIRVFIPWFWHEEYSAVPDDEFRLDPEEIGYAERNGLNHGQMLWRRRKIAGLKGGIPQFQIDYPATPEEAFANSAVDTLIPGKLVQAARQNKDVEQYGAMVLGVDVAREGNDRSAICLRQGRVVLWIKTYLHKDNMELTGLVMRALKEYPIQHIFCDGVGNGSGVVDRLRELGKGDMLTAVKGNHVPLDDVLYVNKRSEMWGEMKDWLEDGPVVLPDDDDLEADLCSLKKKFDSKSRMVLETKADAKKRGVNSPDMGDALGFTFAHPVALNKSNSFEPEEI